MSCMVTKNNPNDTCSCGTNITNQLVQETIRNELLLSETKLREELLTLLQGVESTILVVNTQLIDMNSKLDLLLAK